jgi:hypothetical protein
VGGHFLALNPFVDGIAINAQMRGDFLYGQPAFLHKVAFRFLQSESFPMEQACDRHVSKSVQLRQRKTKKSQLKLILILIGSASYS